MKLKDIYTFENNRAIIELVVFSVDQLFDKRDPNPFLKKDLDEDLADYILSSATEISYKKIGGLRIHLKGPDKISQGNIIQDAIRKYFQYRLELNRRRIKNTLKIGYKSLLIGLLFFSFSIFLSQFIIIKADESFLNNFLKEGFLLLGWVSMWKPVNIFLYDWWPLADIQKILKVLSKIKIELIKEKSTRSFQSKQKMNHLINEPQHFS